MHPLCKIWIFTERKKDNIVKYAAFCGLSTWNISAPTEQILMEFWYLGVLWKSIENSEVLLKSDKNKNAFITFILSYSSLLRMRSVSDRSCRENQNTHFMFSNFCLWSNMEKYCRATQAMCDNIIQDMHIAYSTTKATVRICSVVPPSKSTPTLIPRLGTEWKYAMRFPLYKISLHKLLNAATRRHLIYWYCQITLCLTMGIRNLGFKDIIM